jgi:hypothetical protein
MPQDCFTPTLKPRPDAGRIAGVAPFLQPLPVLAKRMEFAVGRRFSGWKGDQMWNEDLLRPDVLPHKAGASSRTYSSPEVIDSWRGVPFLPPRSQLSITSAAAKKCLVNNPLIWLNRKAEHAGLGRRIPHSSALTLFWRVSLQALRLVAKEYSEPFACKLKTCRDELYKSFHPTGTACSAFEPFNP